MFYVLLILLILFPIFTIFLNNTFKKNLYDYQYILGYVLTPLVLIFAPLTLTKIINNNEMLIIFYTVVSSFIVFAISWTVYYIKKNKINLKENIVSIFSWRTLIYFTSLFLLILFLIFSNFADHDLAYYENISSFFSNGIYSTDGLSELSNKVYLFPTMYYLNGSIFKDDILISYNLINPIIIYLISFSIVNNIINYFYFKSKLFKNIILSLISLSLVFLVLAQLNYSAGGNLVIQSLIILVMVLLIKNKANPSAIYITIFGFSYFSSTGLMTSTIILVSYFVYSLLVNNWRLMWKYIFFLTYLLTMFMFVFTSINVWLTTVTIIFNFLSYGLLLIQVIIIYLLRKKQYDDFNFYKKYICKKKIEYSLVTIFILITIFQIIFFSIIYKLKNTIWELVFITSLINSILIITTIFNIKKENHINTLTFFIFFLELVVILVLTLQKIIPSFKNNESAWRLIYLNPGMGNLTDIFLIIIWLFCLLISNVKIKFFNDRNNKFLLLVTNAMILIASVFSMTNVYSNIFNYSSNENNVQIKMSSDVSYNLNNLSNDDISLLTKYNIGNYQKCYISDIFITPYLNKLADVTSYILVEDNNRLQSYKWNFNNFISGIIEWNTYHKNKQSADAVEIAKLVDNAIKNFASYSISSEFSNITFSSVSYIVLNKNTSYYSECKKIIINNQFQAIDGDDITIFVGN